MVSNQFAGKKLELQDNPKGSDAGLNSRTVDTNLRIDYIIRGIRVRTGTLLINTRW